MLLTRLFIALNVLIVSTVAVAKDVAFTIGYSATDLARVNAVDNVIDEDNPGWFVELSDEAARLCDATIRYRQIPWQRILERVERGQLSAALNSSFKEERAVYGVYPMADGEVDVARAHSHYGYYLYAHDPDLLKTLLAPGGMAGKQIAAEPGSSILGLLDDNGAEVVEITDYDIAMDMLIGSRLDALAGIDGIFDDMIEKDPGLSEIVFRSDRPILERTGYVMFAKNVYADHPEAVECFWTQSAKLMRTRWYQEMRNRYEGQ